MNGAFDDDGIRDRVDPLINRRPDLEANIHENQKHLKSVWDQSVQHFPTGLTSSDECSVFEGQGKQSCALSGLGNWITEPSDGKIGL